MLLSTRGEDSVRRSKESLITILNRLPGNVTSRYILDNPKYRGQVEYFFRWQDEKAQVISDGEHVAIIP